MALVLVTGANGFIGSHLVRELLRRGHKVRGFVRHTSDLSSLKDLPLELFIGDVRDPQTLAAPLQGVEYVYHLAAALLVSSREEFEATNTHGTRNMLEATERYAAGTLKRFLYVSSQAAAGPSRDVTPLDETAELKPVSWYGTSKKLAEQIVGEFAERLPVTIVRPSAVYGERERDISQAFPPIKSHLQPKLGLQTKYTVMVYVADLVQGFIAAAESSQSLGKAYHLTHRQVLTTDDVIKAIAEACGAPTGLKLPVPITLFKLAAPIAEFIAQFSRERPPTTRDKVRELSQRFWVTDPSRAKRDFGWEAQHDLSSGMQPTTRYFFEQQQKLREMPLETRTTRWMKYVTIAILLGILIEITSAIGGFYRFEPWWIVFVAVFGVFGLVFGLVAMILRTRSVLVQLIVGTVLAGSIELMNALNVIPNIKWVFAPNWPLGITDPIGRSIVLGLAGGIFIIIVNSLMLALYKRRLRMG